MSVLFELVSVDAVCPAGCCFLLCMWLPWSSQHRLLTTVFSSLNALPTYAILTGHGRKASGVR